MENELHHYGVLGMKWGVRRYQNKDGSLTPAGKKKYGTKANFEKVQKAKKAAEKSNSKEAKAREKANARTEAEVKKYMEKAGQKKIGDTAKNPETEARVKEKLKKATGNKSETEASKKESLKELSNEELQAKIERTRLENTYRQLMKESISTAQSKQQTSKGKEFVKGMLEGAAKNIGQQTVTYLVGTAVNKTVGKLIGDPNMVNPKKGQKDK